MDMYACVFSYLHTHLPTYLPIYLFTYLPTYALPVFLAMHVVHISISLGFLKVTELFFFSFFGLIIHAFPKNNLEEAETDVQCSLTMGQETLG